MSVNKLAREVCGYNADWHEQERQLGEEQGDPRQALDGVRFLDCNQVEILRGR